MGEKFTCSFPFFCANISQGGVRVEMSKRAVVYKALPNLPKRVKWVEIRLS